MGEVFELEVGKPELLSAKTQTFLIITVLQEPCIYLMVIILAFGPNELF